MAESKKDLQEIEKDQREGWSIKEVAEQGSQSDTDEIQRQTLRGDESQGNPDNRDYAGSSDSKDTPQGREESKNDSRNKADLNG